MLISRSSLLLALTASFTGNKAAFMLSSLGGARAQASGVSSGLHSSSAQQPVTIDVDPEYPGTAVKRMLAARARASELTHAELNGQWEDVRRRILWAGGLKDLTSADPGQGYTGHSFNDFNHVDLTCMNDETSDNKNDGSVKGIAVGNLLGPGVRIASISELGPGGSWSTCMIGCGESPPHDVAHIQFKSRIAFKLVWVPNEMFDTFVLVDDDGTELTRGTPSGGLPILRERQRNYMVVQGSKYARVADTIAQTRIS